MNESIGEGVKQGGGALAAAIEHRRRHWSRFTFIGVSFTSLMSTSIQLQCSRHLQSRLLVVINNSIVHFACSTSNKDFFFAAYIVFA